MRLLVSVRTAAEAGAALEGAAHIIDAKEPAAGPLGPVDAETLSAILAAVPPRYPVSVALGDFTTAKQVYASVSALALARRSTMLKLGFAGARTARAAADLIVTAREAASLVGEPPSIVAVGYADADRVDAPDPWELCEVARRGGAAGVLLDTACKDGAGVVELLSPEDLSDWISLVHLHELTAAVAGKLDGDLLASVALCGADIAGVRGAACDGGRDGRVSAARVAALVAALGRGDGDEVLDWEPGVSRRL